VNKQRRKGTLYSGVFHFLLLVLAIFGLPSILQITPPPEPVPITVDILPVSAMSNVKPREAQPEPPKPEEKPKEAEQKKPSPPVKTAKETAPPPPSEKPAEIKKPVEKKKEPEKKKPDEKKEDKKKIQEDDLAAILKAVKDTAQKEKKDKEKTAAEKTETQAKSERYDESMPLSISEKDDIRNQIAKCWNVPAGAKDAQDLVVTLRLQLEPTGTVLSVELASSNQSRYNSDTFFRAAADSAIRAVRQCSPLTRLDPQKYGTWKDMELTFNPKDMLF
jgi:outer membrane biosynthesis protein TonB